MFRLNENTFLRKVRKDGTDEELFETEVYVEPRENLLFLCLDVLQTILPNIIIVCYFLVI